MSAGGEVVGRTKIGRHPGPDAAANRRFIRSDSSSSFPPDGIPRTFKSGREQPHTLRAQFQQDSRDQEQVDGSDRLDERRREARADDPAERPTDADETE